MKKRIDENPNDVDALVHLGSLLEEKGQFHEAYALYEKAIQARPDCDLGYYFAGLVEDRISSNTADDAQAKIARAVSLNPALSKDPNVQSFVNRRARRSSAAPSSKEEPSLFRAILGGANHFYSGLGCGVLLSALILFLTRLRPKPA